MKTICCLLAAVALLCGCNQKPDPKIAKLEARIVDLESNVDHLTSRCNNQSNYEDQIFSVQTNMLAELSGMTAPDGILTKLAESNAYYDGLIALQQMEITNLLARPTAKSAPVYYRPAQPGAMPAEVAAQIRAHAAERFPNDYDMQLFVIKQQSEAWYKLHQ